MPHRHDADHRGNAPLNQSSRSRLTDRGLRAAAVDHAIFDPSDPAIKHDILQTLIQYLHDEGYHASAMVVQDEANVKAHNIASKRSHLRRMKNAIIQGEWSDVERLLSRTTFRDMTVFKYAVHRQQFLELIEAQETQKAFSLLQRRLKPLEAYARAPAEFRDLCYLLTCKSVAQAPSFRDWDGVAASRTALVDHYRRLLEFDAFQRDASAALQGAREVPPGRLVSLLQQALGFQIMSSRHDAMSGVPPRIGSLLEDYEAVVTPNALQARCVGHEGNIKCVAFVGEEGDVLASGSSDNTVRIWEPRSGVCRGILRGHTSRVWDVSSTANGGMVASASGDGDVRLWDTRALVAEAEDEEDGNERTSGDEGTACGRVLQEHDKDVYTVEMHGRENSVVSGGYDRMIRLHDMETGQERKTFAGHDGAVTSVIFNARGNLIISGGKDGTIRFWDVMSGLCVRTLSAHVGETTCVRTNRAGSVVLSSHKDNSNRMWDVRMGRGTLRFKGHQNTSKNLVRCGFGPRESVVVGGSEDGFAYIWDVGTTEVVGKLGSTGGAVYEATWNGRQSLLGTCGDDGVVSTWYYKGDDDTDGDVAWPR